RDQGGQQDHAPAFPVHRSSSFGEMPRETAYTIPPSPTRRKALIPVLAEALHGPQVRPQAAGGSAAGVQEGQTHRSARASRRCIMGGAGRKRPQGSYPFFRCELANSLGTAPKKDSIPCPGNASARG